MCGCESGVPSCHVLIDNGQSWKPRPAYSNAFGSRMHRTLGSGWFCCILRLSIPGPDRSACKKPRRRTWSRMFLSRSSKPCRRLNTTAARVSVAGYARSPSINGATAGERTNACRSRARGTLGGVVAGRGFGAFLGGGISTTVGCPGTGGHEPGFSACDLESVLGTGRREPVCRRCRSGTGSDSWCGLCSSFPRPRPPA